MRSICWRICVLLAFTAQCVLASDSMPVLYEIVTETGMPHLEESLRYTVARETRCLTHHDLSSAFTDLEQPSLADCTLQYERRDDETISYRLACDGGHGTTGSATWRIADRVLRGALNVKLGGKNMTFYQRVTATPVGKCPAADAGSKALR